MSGHSKWSTIKHKKAKVDSQRAVVFQKYSRELIVSARLGGADPAGNFRLRTAIEKAKAAGLPNDNIKRAIEKGAGAGASDNYEELVYEGYGAGGVAVVVEAMTSVPVFRTASINAAVHSHVVMISYADIDGIRRPQMLPMDVLRRSSASGMMKDEIGRHQSIGRIALPVVTLLNDFHCFPPSNSRSSGAAAPPKTHPRRKYCPRSPRHRVGPRSSPARDKTGPARAASAAPC